MVIGSNTVAAFAARTLADQTNALSSSLARLSSGSRIVSPADDPGGLAVSMK
ncbi:MAG: flagellin, partial [Verrucomicrobiota bacterium]|nr:flagellin [Verrucomicrobiota bacterium]